MKNRPKIEDSRKEWLNMSINTPESSTSLYSKERDKYIDDLEKIIEGAVGLLDDAHPTWNEQSKRWEIWHERLKSLKKKNMFMKKLLEEIRDIVQGTPEVNMENCNGNDVKNMNDAMCDMWALIEGSKELLK